MLFYLPQLHAADVCINEIMSSNDSTAVDEDGNNEDWIEILNKGTESADLSGWGLSDDEEEPFKWVFPEGTSINSGEYLLVWASGKDRYRKPFHTNFSIKKGGEPILLSASDETLVDMTDAVEIPQDISYGRTKADPDKWAFFSSPTPGQENSGPEGHFLLDTVDFHRIHVFFHLNSTLH